MTMNPRVAVPAVLLLLSVGVTGQVAYGQIDPSLSLRLMQLQVERRAAVMAATNAVTDPEAAAAQQRVEELDVRIAEIRRPLDETQEAVSRARELGVEARTARNLEIHGFTGTYVFADEFRLDPETNDVEAIGDVVVTTWEDGRKYSMRADRLTIGEGF